MVRRCSMSCHERRCTHHRTLVRHDRYTIHTGRMPGSGSSEVQHVDASCTANCSAPRQLPCRHDSRDRWLARRRGGARTRWCMASIRCTPVRQRRRQRRSSYDGRTHRGAACASGAHWTRRGSGRWAATRVLGWWQDLCDTELCIVDLVLCYADVHTDVHKHDAAAEQVNRLQHAGPARHGRRHHQHGRRRGAARFLCCARRTTAATAAALAAAAAIDTAQRRRCSAPAVWPAGGGVGRHWVTMMSAARFPTETMQQ